MLKEARSHFDRLDEKFDLKAEFPEAVVRVVSRLHQADRSGTAFRYTEGDHPTHEARIDFPNLASMLKQGLGILCSVEDYVEATMELVEDMIDGMEQNGPGY